MPVYKDEERKVRSCFSTFKYKKYWSYCGVNKELIAVTKEEKIRKIAENMRKHTERYGFPTKPNKKKSKDKTK